MATINGNQKGGESRHGKMSESPPFWLLLKGGKSKKMHHENILSSIGDASAN